MTEKRPAYGVRLERSAALELDRHPGAPRRQPWRSWAADRAAEGPIAVDLFCGAGGLSLGLERAGYTVILSTDNDRAAVETHLANFPGSCLELDLADPERVDDLIGLLDGIEVDVVAGGPPCQPFSRAGHSKIRDLVERGARPADDPRRLLWRVFLRVVEAVRPRSVLMENVPDMALGDDMRMMRVLTGQLEDLGYDTDYRILEAWRHGVPQHRHRLLVVAQRSGTFVWPEESKVVDLREAIGDLPRLGDTTGGREMAYAGPASDFQRRARTSVPAEQAGAVFDHLTRPVRDDDRLAFQLMGEGLSYPELPDELKRYRDDIFDDKYNRLRWDDRSRSITAHIAKDGYWYIHPEEHRTLTVREAARIQTFPDEFRFAGTRTDAFRLIGNAVPPLLAEAVAGALHAGAATPNGELPRRDQRAEIRSRLGAWAASGPVPAWRRAGDPWAVLVGTVAGRGNEADADAVLERFPTPATVTPTRVATSVRRAVSDRQVRVLRILAAVARSVTRLGWDDPRWAAAGSLRASDMSWVEAVGLGVAHVPATAGTLRVAARLAGDADVGGVSGRLLLSQLLGLGDDTPGVLAAAAGLAHEVCRPAAACPICPLSEICPSSGAAAVTA